MRWLNPLDPRVRAAVVSGAWGRSPHSAHYQVPPADPDEIDVVADVLEQASDVLTGLTAATIHPPLQVVEDFVCYPGTGRLTPSANPLRSVVALVAIGDDGSAGTGVGDWVMFGDSVRFVRQDEAYRPLSWLGWEYLDLAAVWALRLGCACPSVQRLRMTYNAGSTITARARAAVLSLAHEFYLQVAPCDECGSCRLPTRTTAVVREGLTYSLADPLTPGVAPGATGLPDVDLWVQQVNPYRVRRQSGVWSNDAPPPVQRAIVSAREQFPPYVPGRVVGAAAVVAEGVVT